MAAPKRETPLQRYLFQRLTDSIRDYIRATMQVGERHRRTTLIVKGDRFLIEDISSKFVSSKEAYNE